MLQPNNYLTSDLISAKAVAEFVASASFIHTAYKGDYESMFKKGYYAPGDTINIRRDNFYDVKRGDIVTPEPIVEAKFPLQIEPLFSVPIYYTPTDLQRDIVSFNEEFIKPAIRALVAKVNQSLYLKAFTQINYYLGSAGAALSTYSDVAKIKPFMRQLGIDPNYNHYLALDPIQAASLQSASSLQNNFVEPYNKKITMDGMLGRTAGLDIFVDEVITGFDAGTHAAGGNITVKTAVSSGSSITLTGLTPGATFVPGDLFSIANTYMWNNVIQQKINKAMEFVVTVGGTANGGGDLTVQVYPEINFSDSRRNIYSSTGDIAAGSVVTPIGSHTKNIAYTERGLVAVMPPLEPFPMKSYTTTDQKSGVSIRVSEEQQILNNKCVMRVDCQAAFSWQSQNSVILLSNIAAA